MSTTTRTNLTQPVLLGGLMMGVLSALPVISTGNLCCCLWVVAGGVLAAYVLQQRQPTPLAPGEGAFVGLLAGIVGACIYLVLSIPIAFLMAPLQRELMRRLADSGNLPPAFRQYVTSVSGPFVGLIFGFLFMLVAGAVFSTLGGLLGAVIFRKQVPPPPPPSSDHPGTPGIIDIPASGL